MKNIKLQMTFKNTYLLTGLGALLFSGLTFAQPQGGHVTGGQGVISTSGNTTQIQQQSHNLAIDWQSFNVGAQEMVRFLQPSTSSTALNRILDQNPSQIFGSIQSNGRVILSNPNGLFFSQSAKVSVGALIASGLNINTEDFMRGNFHFNGLADQAAGFVVNHGLLQASTGGSISLIGGAVNNTGLIIADYGQINLVAGKQVTIDFDGDGLMQFSVDKAVLENAAGISDAVNNSGTLSAQGGEVLLTAHVASQVFDNAVNNEGIIEAGRIENFGGVVRLSGLGGNTLHSGSINVTGQTQNDKGGSVQVLGDNVALLENASIDASGDSGGGTVLVGGGYQGSNATIQNAEITHVGENTTISANANVKGDGGKVILWADDTTRFLGNISATGGVQSGDGGFVETSGKLSLQSWGFVDARADNGNAGNWLLDPTDITIVSGGTNANGAFASNIFTPDATGSEVGVDNINTTLNGGTSVTITTDFSLATQENGDVTQNSDAAIVTSSAAGATFTINAAGTIDLNGGITATGSALNVELNANDTQAGDPTPAAGDVIIDANINTNGGSFTSSGVDFDITGTSLSINTGGGSVLLTHTGSVTIGNGETIDSNGTPDGTIEITSNDIILNGGTNLNSGSATTTLTDSDGTGIGLGSTSVTNGLNLSGTELGQITATGLELVTTGDITVNNISAANSNNINGTTTLTAEKISFASNASTFNALTANAEDGIAVNINVTADTGNLELDGDSNNSNAGGAETANNISLTTGRTLDSAGAMNLDATTGGISGAGTLTLRADDGITINNNLTTAGILNIDADNDANDNTGTLVITSGVTVSTGVNALNIDTNDINLSGNLSSGITSITDSDNTGIGLGATSVTDGLNLSGAELQQISASNLGFVSTGNITVNNISAANSNNISGTTTFTGEKISFSSNASVFNALSANAQDGITVDVNVSTDTGNLALDGDSNNNNAGGAETVNNISFNAGRSLISAGTLTLDATTGGIDGAGALTLQGTTVQINNNITTTNGTLDINGLVTIGSSVTLDTGSGAGDILFDNTLSGGNSLVLNAGTGNISLSTVNSLSSLEVNTSGVLTLNGNITTSGAANFAGVAGGTTLALAGLTTITSTNDDIIFANAISGSAISGNGSLSLIANNATNGEIFLGDVGTSGSPLGGLSLNTGSGNDLTLYGSTYTNGGLNFSNIGTNGNGDVIIADGAAVTLETLSDNGSVLFSDNASTFDTFINGEANNTGSLTINAGAGAVKLARVGQVNPLATLTVNTTGEFSPFEDITTTGDINFLNMSATYSRFYSFLFPYMLIEAPITTTVSGGLTIDTSSLFGIGLGGPNLVTTQGPISVTAGDFFLGSTSTINSGTATTTISDVSGGIRIGPGSNGALEIDNTELGNITTGELILSSVNDVHFYGGGYNFSGPDIFTINAPNTYIYDFVNLVTTTVDYDFSATDINEGIVGDDSRLRFGQNLSFQNINGNVKLGNIGQTNPINFLLVNTTGEIDLSGDITAIGLDLAIIETPSIVLSSDVIIDTSLPGSFNYLDLTNTGSLSSIDGNYSLTLNAGTGRIYIGDVGQSSPLTGLNVTTSGDTFIFGAVDTQGDINIISNRVDIRNAITAQGYAIGIDAGDFDLNTTNGALNTGTGLGSVVINGTSGLDLRSTNTITSALDVSGAELRRITTESLTLSSPLDVFVRDIDASDPALVDIGTIILQSGNEISMGAPVVFNNLTALADNGITVNANLTTTGDLILDADANDTPDGNDNITLGSGGELTSGGSLILAATSGDGIVLDGDFTIIHNGTGLVDLSDIAVNSDPSQSNLFKLTINAALNNSDVILSDIGTTLALSELEINNGDGLVSLGGIIITRGNISLTTTALELFADTTIDTSGGSGALDFSALNINGDNSGFYSLDLITGDGAITLSEVGTSAMLSSLAIDSSGQTLLTGDIKVAGLSGVDMSAATTLGLSGAITLDTRAGNGAVNFSSGVTDGDLIILAGGGEVLLGSSGQNTDLATLVVDTAGQITLGGNVTTSAGDVDFSNGTNIVLNSNVIIDSAGAVDLSGVPVTGNGALSIFANGGAASLDAIGTLAAPLTSLSVASSGPSSLGGNIYTTDNIDLTGADSIVLTANVLMNSGAGSIDLSTSPVSGSGELTLQANAGVSLDVVNGSGALIIDSSQLNLLGDLTIDGIIDFSMVATVSLGGDVIMDTRGGNGSVLLNGGSLDGNQILTIMSGNGPVTFGDIGQLIPLAGLDITTTGAVNLNGNIMTQGDIDLANVNTLVLLSDSEIDSSTNDGLINLFGVDVNGPYQLVLNAGAGNVLLGSVGESEVLTGLSIIGAETRIGSSITTDGDVDLSGTSLEGEVSLVINAGSGGVALGGVGQSTALRSLTAFGSGQSSLNGNITTQGSTGLDLSGLGNILLGDNIVIDSSVNNGAVNLSGGSIDGPFVLTINAANGTSTLGTMGQSNALSSLIVNATGQTFLAGNITTQGPDGINLTNASNLDLVSDSILTSATTGGAITLDGGAVDGNFALTIDTGDMGTLLLGPVGQNDPLASLTIIGNGITTIGANINTQGSDGIDLGAASNILMTTDIALDSSLGDGVIDLTGGALDGNFSLNINSGNGNILLADLGQVDALASLVVSGAGSTDLGGNITTQGIEGIDMSAASNINLSSDVSLDTTLADGSLNLSGASVDGNFNLVLTAGLGEISLGNIGQAIALAGLDVTSLSQLNLIANIAVTGGLNLSAGEITQAQVLNSSAGNISLVSAGSIAMADTASSRTAGGTIDYTANGGSVGLAELDAGDGEVNLNASVDILSIFGSFTNLADAPVNIIAGQTSLVAGDRIGSSSKEPITLDVASGGSISISLGAEKAYINNINRTFITGPDSGNVIDVLADRLEAAAQGQSTAITNSAEAQADPSTDEEDKSHLLVVDGPDFLTEYNQEERTEESTSSLVPDVPLLVRTKDGWAFKRGARSAIDEEEERKRKQRTVDWL